MPEGQLERVLATTLVDDAVFALRPDYRVLILAAQGLPPADDLVARLTLLGPDVRIVRRLIAADITPDEGD